MGNIEQKIEQHAFKGYDYKHFQDDRSEGQIMITDKLTHLLSDLNSARIMEKKNITSKSLDWSKYTFICVHGLPATRNQFQFLQLPGQTVHFGAITFQEDAIKQEPKVRQNFINLSTFQSQSLRLKGIIDSLNIQNNIVFLYHSAGNYFLSMFLFYYGKDIQKRIKGMIDIAGGPLRFYPSARIFIPIVMNTNFEEITQNIDKVHDYFIKTVSGVGFNLGFRDKYETASFFRYMKTPDYNSVFQSTWNYPKVLKLIIHGRKDTFFNSTLLNQKAIFYTYKRQLQQSYEKKMLEKYKNLYQCETLPKNIQERFIFAIPKGQHSVHKQPRNQELIKSAVQQYLTLIHE